MSLRNNIYKIGDYLNDGLNFPIFLLGWIYLLSLHSPFYSVIKAIPYLGTETGSVNISEYIVIFFLIFLWVICFIIPSKIRKEGIGIEFLETVDSNNYKSQIELLKSILINDYGQNFDFEVKKGKDCFIGIEQKIIFVKTGFLNWVKANADENKNYIIAILGHEIGHHNREFQGYPRSTLILIPIITFLAIFDIFIRINHFRIYWYIAILLSYLFLFRVSIYEEYSADKGSIELGNKKIDLINALISISECLRRRYREHYPKMIEWIIESCDTHPSFENRIKRLKKLENTELLYY